MSIFPDEDGNAQLACRNNDLLGAVCAGVLSLGVVSCASIDDWGSVDAWATHRQHDFVGDGAAPESAFSELSSRA